MRIGRIEAVAAGLGAVTGIRSLAGLTLLAHRVSGTRQNGASRGMRRLASPKVVGTATALAFGEALADKWADLPARTRPAPFLGRIALGALAAGLFASLRRERLIVPALLGATAAALAAATATNLRRTLTRRTRTPDAVIGMIEDAAVVAGSLWLARAITRAESLANRVADERWTDGVDDASFDESVPDEPAGIDEIIAGTLPNAEPAPWWSGPVEPIERAYEDPDQEDEDFGEPGRSEIT